MRARDEPLDYATEPGRRARGWRVLVVLAALGALLGVAGMLMMSRTVVLTPAPATAPLTPR